MAVLLGARFVVLGLYNSLYYRPQRTDLVRDLYKETMVRGSEFPGLRLAGLGYRVQGLSLEAAATLNPKP